jgi:cytochrome c oxidase subunit 2
VRVRITGRDFRWHIRYPGPDGVLDTADDRLDQRNLHVPASTDVELELCSDDFVYSLYLPDYELVEMAFPGRPLVMEFRTDSPGRSRLMGSQMCGFAHEELLGKLVVDPPGAGRSRAP